MLTIGLNNWLQSYLSIPLVLFHSFLVPKVLLLLVTTFQDYYHFKPTLNIENIIKIMIWRLKTIFFSLYFNKKKILTTLGFTVHNGHKQIPGLLSSHQLNLYSLRTISAVKLQLQYHVSLHAHINSITLDLRQCRSMLTVKN